MNTLECINYYISVLKDSYDNFLKKKVKNLQRKYKLFLKYKIYCIKTN